MNPNNHGESSDNLSGLPLKRKRGRPRKDRTLNHTAMAHQPQGFEATRQAAVPETMVGQAVNGVIEASFDSGYLLSVRIGNSNANLRGVVFKPGHFVPVTTENDIAPHLPMIQRESIAFGGGNLSSARGQKLTVQRAGAKRRNKSQENRGNVVPGTLQHINFQTGQQTIGEGDIKDVNMVEPLSADRTIPVSELFVMPHAHNDGGEVGQGSEQDDDVSLNDGTTSEDGQGEKSKVMVSTTDVDTPGSSSQMSDINAENGKEVMKSSGEDSSVAVSNQELENIGLPDSNIIPEQAIENANMQFSTEFLPVFPVTTPPFLNFGTGKMTELLQAMQDNVREAPVFMAAPPPSVSNAEINDETLAAETDQRDNASAP